MSSVVGLGVVFPPWSCWNYTPTMLGLRIYISISSLDLSPEGLIKDINVIKLQFGFRIKVNNKSAKYTNRFLENLNKRITMPDKLSLSGLDLSLDPSTTRISIISTKSLQNNRFSGELLSSPRFFYNFLSMFTRTLVRLSSSFIKFSSAFSFKLS